MHAPSCPTNVRISLPIAAQDREVNQGLLADRWNRRLSTARSQQCAASLVAERCHSMRTS
jgi:hypothetical protein